jgi:hypothetical protein
VKDTCKDLGTRARPTMSSISISIAATTRGLDMHREMEETY